MSAASAIRSQNGLSNQLRQRRFVDQVGRMTLAAVLGLTAVVFVIMPILALWWLQTPWTGAFIEYPLAANPAVAEPFEGTITQGSDATNLIQNDSILSVNGQPVVDYLGLRAALVAIGEGEFARLDVINDNGRTRSVQLLLEAVPVAAVMRLFVISFITGLLYVATGLWVYRSRRQHVVGRYFMLFCASIGVLFATLFDLYTTHFFVRLWTASLPLAAGLLISFSLIFPVELPIVARRPMLRWLPLLPMIAVLAIAQFMISTPDHRLVTLAWRIQYITASLGGLSFMLIFAFRSVFSESPTVREQSRVVFAGAFIAFLPFVAWALRLFDIPIGWVLLSFAVFPLTIAYSIIQYNVLNTSRFASFATTYGIMGVLAALGYSLVIAGINLVLIQLLGLNDKLVARSQPALVAALVFVLVLGFQPLRQRIQELVDRLFFRSMEDYERRLTDFRHNLTLVSNLGDIVRLLKQQIRETLVPTHTYVFLRDVDTGEFMAAAEGLRADTDVRFEAQSGLVHALSTARDVLFLELNKPLPPELVEEHARLAILRAPVLAPLHGQERLAGWVAVGNKRSGDRYSIEDLRFIQALCEQASLAVERAQVIGDLERRVRELDVLSQVSQAVNFTADPDVLMELIYTQSGKLIDATNFHIILRNDVRNSLSYAFYVEGSERYNERENQEWPPDEDLSAEVIRTGRPIRTDDYLGECRRRGVKPRQERYFGWMGVPLNAGQHTLGAMAVASYTQGVTFTDDQMRFFWAIADQAATALDKSRLFHETETRARQLATLNDISKELSSTLDLQNLLVRIMRSAVEMIGTEAGSLFLVDETSGDLTFRVVEGGAQDLVGTRIPAGRGIVGEAATTAAPVIVNSVTTDRRWYSDVDRETEFQTQSLLAVPLLVQDKVIGVLEVINKLDASPFDSEDVSLLATFAAQAAVAIDNARLYEATDAELAARIDELQNLVRIDRELNRTLQLQGVIDITLNWAMRITGAGAGLLAMLDKDNEGLRLLAAQGYQPDWVEQHREEPITRDTGVLYRVLDSGKPTFIEDIATEAIFKSMAQQPTVSLIAVPILRANRPIGALVLESHIPDLLSIADFEFAQRLVEHAAVAIENARLIEEVARANRDKTEFISFVAHELKNPMTSIRGYTDLLKSGGTGPVNDMQAQFLSTIRSNVDRMTRLVSDLSDVARIETGHMRLERSPIPVQGIIEETLRGLQAQISDKKQELHLDIDENLPRIMADHTRMVQVLVNLVSNAHKYTPENGQIWVGAKLENRRDEHNGAIRSMVHLFVRDTGIGMAPDELEQLFTKFFRTARAKDMAQGTGLGLIITRNLILGHEGDMWVESEVGAGTTFHFTVPAAPETTEQAAD